MQAVRNDSSARGHAAGLRVVLVEDHAGYREQLRELIHALDRVTVIHTADNEQDAVQWLAGHADSWDVLVLDIFLPDGHGFKVLRACSDRAAHQRAVFLTSYTRPPAQDQALTLGADAVFGKTEVAQFLSYLAQERDSRLATLQ